MKAQFKYAFLAANQIRGITFAVIFVINTVFIILGALGWLPTAAKITAVSLGGAAIAVMLAANIVCDVLTMRRMFASPESYLYMLTPSPRWKILFSSVIAALAMDLVSMTVVITQEVWLAMILNGNGRQIREAFLTAVKQEPAILQYSIYGILLLIAGYLLVMMIILFSVTARKSFLYKLPASGLLSFLLACACVYAVNLLHVVLIPFGTVTRFRMFFIISIGSSAMPFYILLLLLEAAGLFILTAKLMERKINI